MSGNSIDEGWEEHYVNSVPQAQLKLKPGCSSSILLLPGLELLILNPRFGEAEAPQGEDTGGEVKFVQISVT